jgi:hypothetical protein
MASVSSGSARRLLSMPRWWRAGLLLAGMLFSIAVETHIRTGYFVLERGEEVLVEVRWAERVGPLDRWRLERRLGLTFATRSADRWWSYHMPDAASRRLEDIVTSPAVADTRFIDRATMKPEVVVTDFAGSRLPVRLWLARAVAWLWPVAVFLMVPAVADRVRAAAASALLSSRWRVPAIVAAVYLLTWIVRWLTVDTLGGDDHWSLWTATSFLKGDRPFLEFTDAGDPLYWGMSALAQALVGYRAIGEVLLGVSLTALGLTLGFRMAWRASGSLAVGLLLAATASLLIGTVKLYSYPKIFAYPLGLWLAWHYIDRPSLKRALLLGAGVGVAWGYRHDHGAYVAVGASAAVVAAHWHLGIVNVAGALCRVGLATIAVLSPYLALVQAREGILPYFQTRISFAASLDSEGRHPVPLVIDDSQPMWWGTAAQVLPIVGIRWAAEVSPEMTRELVAKYSLAPIPPRTGSRRPYYATDTSTENLKALVGDAQVLDVEGVRAEITTIAAAEGARPVKVVTDVVVLPQRNDVGPDVLVRWAPSVTDAERIQLERQYHLAYGHLDDDDPTQTIWEYQIADQSVANVTALARDKRVVYKDQFEVGPEPGTFAARPFTPAPGVGLWVTWAADLGDAERSALEAKYRLLVQPAFPGDFIGYTLADARPANVRALLDDERVKDTAGLDRHTGRVNGDSWFAGVRRTYPWLALAPFPRLLHQRNAGVFVYYVSYGLPFVVLALLLIDRLRRGTHAFDGRKMIAAAAMMGVANLGLLKQLGYLADHFDMAMVMAAWLIGRAFAGSWRASLRSGAGVAAVLFATAITLSAVSYVNVPRLVDHFELTQSPAVQWRESVKRFTRFAASPAIDSFAPSDATGDRALIRYLYECTRPDDHIWVTSDLYAVPYYTERPVVGHVFWAAGFMTSPEYQHQIIDLVEHMEVPIIIGTGGESALALLKHHPLVRDYVARRFTREINVPGDRTGAAIWLLTDSRRAQTGTYAKLGLPCFR